LLILLFLLFGWKKGGRKQKVVGTRC
jgi:hypothetical protein